jgi:hypothetical protein
MSEENMVLGRRYFEEIWDKGSMVLIDELFTANSSATVPLLLRERCAAWRTLRALCAYTVAPFLICGFLLRI